MTEQNIWLGHPPKQFYRSCQWFLLTKGCKKRNQKVSHFTIYLLFWSQIWADQHSLFIPFQVRTKAGPLLHLGPTGCNCPGPSLLCQLAHVLHPKLPQRTGAYIQLLRIPHTGWASNTQSHNGLPVCSLYRNPSVQGLRCWVCLPGWPLSWWATILALASATPCCPYLHIAHEVGECCWLLLPFLAFCFFQCGGKTMPLESWSMLYKYCYHGMIGLQGNSRVPPMAFASRSGGWGWAYYPQRCRKE